MYVRFRCARCKRVGEQLVREEEWDPAVLKVAGSEVSDAQLHHFEKMGPILPEEIIDFHYALDELEAEPDPAVELPLPRPTDARRRSEETGRRRKEVGR